MSIKTTAMMLLATALPFSEAFAHSIDKKGAPVNDYLYVMLGIGAAYALFLMVRMQRRKHENQN